MKKILKKATLAILIINLIIPLTVNAEFMPMAQTPYAQEFINKSQNQKWFLDEIEKYLNQEQKTINKLNSKEELNNITSLGLTTKNINGQIPQAIGELTNLKYLNNQIRCWKSN